MLSELWEHPHLPQSPRWGRAGVAYEPRAGTKSCPPLEVDTKPADIQRTSGLAPGKPFLLRRLHTQGEAQAQHCSEKDYVLSLLGHQRATPQDVWKTGPTTETQVQSEVTS